MKQFYSLPVECFWPVHDITFFRFTIAKIMREYWRGGGGVPRRLLELIADRLKSSISSKIQFVKCTAVLSNWVKY